MGAAYPRLTTATLRLAAQAEQGNVSSALQAGENIATSAFLALTGTILALGTVGTGFGGLYVIILCAAVLPAVVALRFIKD